MKLSTRGKRILQNSIQNQGYFLQDLQNSLVQQSKYPDTSINQFQRIYHQKKKLSLTIDHYQQKNQYYKNDIQHYKQRIYQIDQLNNKANKQSILLKNQINKINDAHMISKILMMQKIVKLNIENENNQKKKQKYNQIRQQKQRIYDVNQMMYEKKQKKRQISLMESKAIKNYINQVNQQQNQQNRARAESVKSEKQRRKQKLLRYEKFKLEQARKNYLSKTEQLRKTIFDKEKLLQKLWEEQIRGEKYLQTTKEVTKQYLSNIYKNNNHKDVQSTLFATQTLTL